MMNDNQYTFYEVCEAAEAYFETHDKNVEGSGWKGYQRWKNANEYKFYPSGERNNVDPLFAAKAYEDFLAKNPQTKSLYNNGWNEIGPLLIDSITGHYAPGYGRIEDLYVDPNNANTVYVGSRSGGFWRSTDGGATWLGGSTDFLFASGVNTFAVDPNNASTILINLRNSNNGYSHGIYQSFDGGASFTPSNFSPTNLGVGGLGSSFRIFKIAYHPTIPNLIFIGTSRGIYRSDDNLATWTRLISAGDITAIDFHPTNPNILYALDTYSPNNKRDYVYISTDLGLSYSLSNQISANNNSTGRISVSNACPSCLYFASTNGVWRSTDEGANFTFLSTPAQSCHGFAVNDQDTSKMIYGYVDIEISDDGGQTFEKNTWWSLGSAEHGPGGFSQRYLGSDNYVHADLRIAKCINGVFYVGTDGMFAKSLDNGQTWQHLSEGLGVRENYKLGASQSNHFRTVSGSQDNGTSIKTESNWVEFYGADGMEGIIHPLNHDWIIGSFQYGGRRRTKNGGATQSGVSPNGQSGSGSGAWEAPITYDPNEHLRIYNFSDSVYVSEDFGSNWTFRGLPSSFSGTINQAAIAENNSNIIVISKSDDIDKSLDGGATFSSIKANLPNHYIEDIAFHPKDDDIIFVVYARYFNDNEKIFMTTDGGANWTNITYNLGDMPLHTVVVDHTDASNIYVGAEIGVYTMPLNGSNWVLYNPNLPNTTVEELEIVYGSNTLKAATWGRGMWEYSLLGRNDFPAILTTSITDMPTQIDPKEGVDQFVTSTISYENTLTDVYVEWSINTPSFGNVLSMTNTQDSTWVSNQALPNFPAGTKLFFKVFAVGSNADTSETYKFMYTVEPFEYCSTTGTMQYQGNVTLVNFNTINNATGKTQSFTDYTATDSTSLYIGQNYDLTVNLNTDNGNYTYFSRVWIDWNRDADFDDAGEEYDIGSATDTADGSTSLSPFEIIVPSHALPGPTTMRVACRYLGYPNLCDENFDGEVEDYRLNIVTAPNITFNYPSTDVCLGDNMQLNYTGDVVDSVNWSFVSLANSFEVSGINPIVNFSNEASYSVVVSVFLDGFQFFSDSTPFVFVHGLDNVSINEFTCNILDTGTMVQNLVNVFGCDSIVTTTTTFGSSINTAIDYIDGNLVSQEIAASYQWLDCDQNYTMIIGETGQQFTPQSNGSYAVAISAQSCIDTSACLSVTNVSINDLGKELVVLVYPNPVKDVLTIALSVDIENYAIHLQDVLGRTVLQNVGLSGKLQTISLTHVAVGTYFLELSVDGQREMIEIVKK